jgi:hypothetical protein
LRQLALDDPRSWLIASARYFQGLGFYMEYLDLPDDALLEAIRQAVRWHWDEPLPPEEVSRDLQLADMVLLLGIRVGYGGVILKGCSQGKSSTSVPSPSGPRSRAAPSRP